MNSNRTTLLKAILVACLILSVLSPELTARAAAPNNPLDSSWSPAASMQTARAYNTITLLPDGHVLVAGGWDGTHILSSVELYNPTTNTWTPAAPMHSQRSNYTATLLLNGQVLVAGGSLYSDLGTTTLLSSAELYNPANDTWTLVAPMQNARTVHTATLLADGRVLVVGGWTSDETSNSVEIYDPASNKWTPAANTSNIFSDHEGVSAALLKDGRVLLTGGFYGSIQWSDAWIFDPTSESLSYAKQMDVGYRSYSLTLLPSGKVLAAGGNLGPNAELYNPASNSWKDAASMLTTQSDNSATLLADGRVLVVGGETAGSGGNELYDPVSNKWQAAGGLSPATYAQSAVLLLDGRVLVVGGRPSGVWGANNYNVAKLYAPNASTDPTLRPVITTAPFLVALGSPLQFTGTGLSGQNCNQASGASPSTNPPLVQLRRLDNSQVAWLTAASFCDTNYVSAPLSGIEPGPALLTVFVNGIPSISKMVMVNPARAFIPFTQK